MLLIAFLAAAVAQNAAAKLATETTLSWGGTPSCPAVAHIIYTASPQTRRQLLEARIAAIALSVVAAFQCIVIARASSLLPFPPIAYSPCRLTTGVPCLPQPSDSSAAQGHAQCPA